MCCIGLPWERNADLPQLLFYLLDIVIHLMLRLGEEGGERGREGEGALGAFPHLNHSGKLRRRQRSGQAWAGAEVVGLGSVPPTARPPARRRLVCMQGRAGPSGREAPTPAPSH